MSVLLIAGLVSWGIVTGMVFSTIGAAGGILTSFGLISLFGVMDPNSVKPMTQIVTLATGLLFLRAYLRSRSMVVPLGILLGLGGLAGAWVGSTLSSMYLADMKSFRPLFGALTLAIAAQILWKLRHAGTGKAAICAEVSDLSITRGALSFAYGEARFRVPLWSPLAAGFGVAVLASLFGVGGGFLLVPYMAAVLGLPMFVIPGTAAIAIIMALSVSIANFVARGAVLDWDLLVPLLIGALIGAQLGPMVNRRARNSWLQAGLAIVLIGIGLKYLLA